jgi:hypothetical protein
MALPTLFGPVKRLQRMRMAHVSLLQAVMGSLLSISYRGYRLGALRQGY